MDRIRRLVEADGVVITREQPELRSTLDWMHRTGRLDLLLPGAYTAPGAGPRADLLIAAVARLVPTAVFTGAAAARMSFWPEIPVPLVTAVSPHRRVDPPGVAFSRRAVPAGLVWHLAPDPQRPVIPAGLRCTVPALTAWDLVGEYGGDVIDEVLRRGGATLAELTTALELTPGRRGNRHRRELLLDSRDQPWSPAERRAHRILRRAGLVGWRANHPVTANGRRYRVDLAWPGLRLVVEIDGRRWHSETAVFESDRQRQNDLVLAGWTVIRLTWRMLDDEQAVIALLTRMIRRLENQHFAPLDARRRLLATP